MSGSGRKVELASVGITNPGTVHWSLGIASLYEEAIRRGEGMLSADGPIVCITSPHTGRSPNDKFVVKEASSEAHVDWGKVNRPIAPELFDALHARMMAALEGKELFVQDVYAGADPAYRLPVRLITEKAWHSLFVHHMFINEPDDAVRLQHDPQFTVIDIPSFKADPAVDGTRSETFILLNFAKKLVLIGGTNYAGEMKKSIFTVMNYLLPLRDTMPMHCSANVGEKGDVALFFGLSGTGKTTLSSDPHRGLIGDDEHGWSAHGVFNFEGGCYAKTIRLSREAEPQIYATTERFGTLIENVVMDPVTRKPDFDSDAITENTRCAYPLSFIDNAVPGRACGTSHQHRDAHGRCLRRPAAHRALVAGRGDVPLPLGVHREGGRHRTRRQGTECHIQHVFWRAVHGVGSERVREVARRAHRETQRTRVAGQHRVDRRAVRGGDAHEDRVHPRDDQRGAGRCP